MKSTDEDPTRARFLVGASGYLIDHGFYGLVWLSPDLTVQHKEGPLVDFVVVGQPVGLTILQLYGLDDQFHALRLGQRKTLELSNVSLVNVSGDGVRLNFYVHWMQHYSQFLIIVARTTNQHEFEAELENQSRRTALAEAELVEKAKEIAKANEKLQRANRELSEFAYVLSHDLNAPLRAMRYQIEDIEAGLQSTEGGDVSSMIDTLKRQERRMSSMMRDLLEYARIGQLEDAVEPTNTFELVREIAQTMPLNGEITIGIEGEWPRLELASPALDLVLRNLIDNAIKHHDRRSGKITLRANPTGAGVEIEVTDDGPGIPHQHQRIIFQPFKKVPVSEGTAKAGQPSTDGSGIGLALVRKTAEAVGAKLTLDSDPPTARGTTFRLYWPGRPVSDEQENKP